MLRIFKKILITCLLALCAWMSLQIYERGTFARPPKAPDWRINCAFCRQEVLDRQTVYEGAHSLVLLTYKPAVQGHLLIIPQRHVERFEDLSAVEVAEMKEMVAKVDQATRRIFGTTGYLLLQKNGQESGQTVPHVHIHYCPRYKGSSHILFTMRYFLSSWFKPLSTEAMRRQMMVYETLD